MRQPGNRSPTIFSTARAAFWMKNMVYLRMPTLDPCHKNGTTPRPRDHPKTLQGQVWQRDSRTLGRAPPSRLPITDARVTEWSALGNGCRGPACGGAWYPRLISGANKYTSIHFSVPTSAHKLPHVAVRLTESREKVRRRSRPAWTPPCVCIGYAPFSASMPRATSCGARDQALVKRH